MVRTFISTSVLIAVAANLSFAADPATVAGRLETMAGAEKNVKVVWVRGTKPGAEMGYLANPNPSCVLMGYDSKKGVEDTISKTVKNYTRPLITADGKRIVYSSTTDTTVNIVNWDGTNSRIITKGLAGCLWFDTLSRREFAVCVKECFLECKENVVLVDLYDTTNIKASIGTTVGGAALRIHPHLTTISGDGKFLCLDYTGNGSSNNQALVNSANSNILVGMLTMNGFWPSTPYDTSYRMIYFSNSTRDSIRVMERGSNVKSIPLDFCIPEENCAVGHLKMAGYNPSLAAYVVGSQNVGSVVVIKFNAAFSAITDTVTVSAPMKNGFPDVWTPSFNVEPDTIALVTGIPGHAQPVHSSSILQVTTVRGALPCAVLTLASADKVSAVLYTITGRIVWRMDSGLLDAGVHYLTPVNTNIVHAAGNYFLAVKVGARTITRSMVITTGH
jgi:hypothetical protein